MLPLLIRIKDSLLDISRYYTPKYILVSQSNWEKFTRELHEEYKLILSDFETMAKFNSNNYIGSKVCGLSLIRVLDELNKEFEIV